MRRGSAIKPKAKASTVPHPNEGSSGENLAPPSSARKVDKNATASKPKKTTSKNATASKTLVGKEDVSKSSGPSIVSIVVGQLHCIWELMRCHLSTRVVRYYQD